MTVIPKECERNLRLYKYAGTDRSLVSRYILTPYWNALVKLFPMWMAPNLITLLGLLCIVANVGTLLYYAPDLGPCPNWVYYSFGLGLFVYQSLDAIDGKQARRTGMSGPLGELFDHGCDALNTTLGVLTWASATSLGQSWWTVASLGASLGNFYLSTWEEYHTGVLYLGYFSGPVEGVLMLVAIQIVSGMYGPSFWEQHVNDFIPPAWVDLIPQAWSVWTGDLGRLQLNHILILIGGIVLLGNIGVGLINVIKVKWVPTDYSRRNVSSAAAILGLLPYLVMCGLCYDWMRHWPDLVHQHLTLFMLLVGLLFGHQVGLIIIAHVAKLDFPYINTFMVNLLSSGCLVARYDYVIEQYVTLDHRVVVLAYLGIAVGHYIRFVVSVIWQICAFFDIGCLHIKSKAKPSQETRKSK